MQPNLYPFNIDLLIPTKEDLKSLTPITVLDTYDGMTKNFHPGGLFSTQIFGKVGEERRNRLYSYIKLYTSILHPILFKSIVDLKGLYGEIMSGSSYAIFDKESKDFIKSNPLEGKTGYAFFIKHLNELHFEERPSARRETSIKLVNKYRSNGLFSYLLVMPAGLRDYEIDENGKPSEDEINTLYRKVFSISSMIENIDTKLNEEYLNTSRYNLQIAVNQIYDYIKAMLEGKEKFILGKWTTRKIFNSTRNVITSYVHNTSDLNDERTISTNQTIVGLYQYLRAVLPLAIKQVRDTYLLDVFVGPNNPAVLVNKTTLKKELVNIDSSYYDEWMTFEGLESIFARFGQENLRHDVLEIEDHYLGLVYKGPDMTFKFVQDKDDVPSDRSDNDLYPITFCELLYMSVFRNVGTIPCLVTRYPITGYGSIYPSYVYLKTTNKSESRTELDDSWEKTNDKAIEFPIVNTEFFNSMTVSNSHLPRLGADFDGDMLSLTCLLTEESKEEVKKLLNSRNYYVGINNKMSFTANTDIIDLTLKYMTGN